MGGPRLERHVLVNPPLVDVGESTYVNHPTGLLKVGAWLLSRGHRVEWIDGCPPPRSTWGTCQVPRLGPPVDLRRCGAAGPGSFLKPRYRFGLSDEALEAKLRRLKRVDGFWIGSLMTYHWEGVHRTVELCRRVHPGVPIHLGGTYATLCPDHARASGADEVVAGEFPPASDLPPAYDLLGGGFPRYAVVKTTRGCPRRCTYCAVHLLEGPKLRHRPIPEVMRELRGLHRRGVREFVFWESNITHDAERYLEPLLEEIAAARLGARLLFPEGFDPSHLSVGLCRLLRRAGTGRVVLSLESVDPGLRRSWRKQGPVEAYVEALAHLREAGFRTGERIERNTELLTFVLVGLPGQTLEAILRTVLFVWSREAVPQLMRFTPIPGTVEHRRHAARWARRGLEGLAPGLWPGASRDLRADDLEELYQRFHGRVWRPEHLRAMRPDSRVLALVAKLARDT